MRCPACSNVLKKFQVKETELDVCYDGCAGIWFDHDEFFEIDDPNEAVSEELLNLKPTTTVDTKAKRFCPHCPSESLVKQFLDTKNQVEVDVCWQCSGVWLDHGELMRVRTQFGSPEQRSESAKQLSEEVLNDLSEKFKKEILSQDPEFYQKKNQKNRRASRFIGKLLGIKELLRD